MKTNSKIIPLFKSPIDRLGDIKAQLADLKKVEKALTEEISAMGTGAHEGDLFRASVSEILPSFSLDTQAAEQKLRELGVDNRWFSKHQKLRAGYTMVRVSGRVSK